MLLTCVDPQPGGPWAELKRASHRVMQRPGCVLSHSSLQVAQKAPEYPGPTACVPRPAREVSGAVCVPLVQKSLDAVVRVSEASDTHTTHPPFPGRLSTAQTNWFLLAAAQCHWLLWEASLSTATHSSWTHLRFQRCAAAAAAHQIGPCHAAANESCALGSTSQGGQPIGAGCYCAGLSSPCATWANSASPSPESRSSRHGFKKTTCLISTVVIRQIRQHRVSCGSQASRRRWYLRRDQRRYPPSAKGKPFQFGSRPVATSSHGIAYLLPHRAFSFWRTMGL